MIQPASGRMRVVYLVGSLEIGGAERQLICLANALDRTRFQPILMCVQRGAPLAEELASDVPVVTLNFHAVRGKSPLGAAITGVRLVTTLWRQLRRLHPDILHAYMLTAYVPGSLAAWLARVPVIIAARRGLVSYDRYPRRWRVAAWLANRVIHLHLCNSEAIRRWALEHEHLPSRKTAVIRNALNPLATRRPDETPVAWPRPPGEPAAAMIANLIVYKGHRTLLEALADVRTTVPGFNVVLFGDGPEREALQEQARRLGIEDNVVFAGRRLDASRLVGSFDFSLLTSYQEGLSNALLESMAAGVPVVASRVGGIPETVDDGVDGLLVPPADPAALARAILWMIEHPDERRRMGEAARRHATADFSLAKMVDATETTYLQQLHRQAPRRLQVEGVR
jgi:glycosyltransferase involved in cell wall biosynthesis